MDKVKEAMCFVLLLALVHLPPGLAGEAEAEQGEKENQVEQEAGQAEGKEGEEAVAKEGKKGEEGYSSHASFTDGKYNFSGHNKKILVLQSLVTGKVLI